MYRGLRGYVVHARKRSNDHTALPLAPLPSHNTPANHSFCWLKRCEEGEEGEGGEGGEGGEEGEEGEEGEG